MKKMNNYWGGEYQAPALEVLDVTIENGFAASVEASYIDDATTEDWGTL